MKTYIKFALLAIAAVSLYMTEFSPRLPSQGWFQLQELELVKEAQAAFGVRRRTRRRSVAVGYTMGAAAGKQQAAAQQQQAVAQQQAATAEQQAATAQQQAQSAGPPIGSIVTVLPTGCVTTAKGGVQYFNCNGVFYRAAFQGNNLVYVVAQP